MTEFQSDSYLKNDPNYLSELEYQEPKEFFKVVTALIKEGFSDGRSLSLLDVGCAAGAFLYFAQKEMKIARCVGTDISDKHIEQAREHVKSAEFYLDSILQPKILFPNEFDVCVCLGVLSIFDEIDDVLLNLLSFVKPGGMLFTYEPVNDYPVDVMMRYRVNVAEKHADWKAAFNIRSKVSYERILESIDSTLEIRWHDFKMPFALPYKGDPMRAWTLDTEQNPHQLVVGTGQMLNFKVLQVIKAK